MPTILVVGATCKPGGSMVNKTLLETGYEIFEGPSPYLKPFVTSARAHTDPPELGFVRVTLPIATVVYCTLRK